MPIPFSDVEDYSTFTLEYENEETNISIQLIDHLEKGTPLHELVTVDFNIRAMAVLDAGMRACESGNSETIKKIW